jgi:hypothetical protein
MTRGVGGKSPSNVALHLKGINFPAGKQRLVDQAMKNQAEEQVIQTIEKMPEREYRTMADVMHEYGQVR